MDLLNYMSCCNNFLSCDDVSVGEYCGNCYSLTDAPTFESIFTERCNNAKIRENKFFTLLLTGDLPWMVRQTLVDVFPKIESHFHNSARTNFIHMGQLIIELLKVIGYPEYVGEYKGLKTATRIKMVEKFVKDALKGDIRTTPLPRLEDLDYIQPADPFVDFSKVYRDDHIYSDRNKSK